MFLPVVLVLLVIAQVALGMWTVTLLLKPIVVTAHLLGGLTMTALLWWVALRHGGLFTGYARPLLNNDGVSFAPWILIGIVVLYVQLFLGGWVSTNYAALVCADFPLCQGQLLPTLDFEKAMTPWHGLGIDYEGGILATDARVTIHLMHRFGALVGAAGGNQPRRASPPIHPDQSIGQLNQRFGVRPAMVKDHDVATGPLWSQMIDAVVYSLGSVHFEQCLVADHQSNTGSERRLRDGTHVSPPPALFACDAERES